MINIYSELNNTDSSFTIKDSIPKIFESIVDQHKARIALRYQEQTFTYEEVNKISNRIGNFLLSRKLKGKNIGIFLERSPEVYFSIIGILKCGGAYVPLDPSYPVDRLNFMVKDADVDFIITSRNLLVKNKMDFEGADILYIEDILQNNLQDTNLNIDSSPIDLAYIMYTSGSTGLPKGVRICHQGIIRLVINPNYIEISKNDVFLQFAPITFDASTFEIWGSLLNGAELVIFPNNNGTLEEFENIINRNQVSISWFTSGLFNQMVDNTITAFKNMRWVLTGGDIVSKNHINALLKKYKCTVINGYGPTENTTFTCCYKITEPLPDHVNSVPIGKPISNTQIYVLDKNLKEVGIGETGELYTGGLGLALGYQNRDDLNSKSFISYHNKILYKTGDFVKILPDLNLEFVGRIDNQLKIRGFRIETDEIKYQLNSHPNIKDSLIEVVTSDSGHKSLVAYFMVAGDVETSTIGSYLSSKLPAYMTPDILIPVTEFPLTQNGKVDRKALPNPFSTDVVCDIDYISMTPTAIKIINIYKESLKVKTINPYVSFFSMGGNSLLAMEIISNIKKSFGIKLSFNEYYNKSSVYDLEQLLLKKEKIDNSVTKEVVRESKSWYPCSYNQMGLWFLNKLFPSDTSYNIVKRFRINGKLNVLNFKESLKLLIQKQPVLKTIFLEVEDKPIQKLQEDISTPLEFINLLANDETEREIIVNRYLLREHEYVFDLSNDSLVRFLLIQVGEKEYDFIINIHHIICDGISIQIMLKDISCFYRYLEEKKETELLFKDLNSYYHEYAEYQHGYLKNSSTMKLQLDYWRDNLVNAVSTVNFYSKINELDDVAEDTSGICKFIIPSIFTNDIKDISKDMNTTVFNVLLAAFNILIYRYTNQQDISIGTSVSNRDTVDAKHTVGYYINTLVLRNKLNPEQNFEEILHDITINTMKSLENMDVPFEEVVRFINPERMLSKQSPLFNIMFNYHQFHKSGQLSESIIWEEKELDIASSKFDITLNLYNTNNIIEGEFIFKTSCYDIAFIKQLSNCYVKLLSSIIENRQEKIDLLNMLPVEKERNILSINNHECIPEDLMIYDLFDKKVEEQPYATAVVYKGKEYSYKELDQLSKKILNFFYRREIGCGEKVGICLDRSPKMIASIIAIWKKGCAYVPISKHWPHDYKKHVTKQAEIKIILTEQQNHDFDFVENVILIEDKDISKEELFIPSVSSESTRSNSLAYITFTSGTTGKPKGVLTRHTSVVNYLYYLNNTYSISNLDTIIQIAPITFDASIRDIFGTLVWGGKLIIPNEEEYSNPFHLVDLIRKYSVTGILSIVPSFAESITNVIKEHLELKTNSLRLILLSGEQLKKSLVEDLDICFGSQVTIVNQYGPTEATLTTTYYVVDKHNQDILVGKAIPNQKVYLLDNYLKPVPLGAIGRIYIGGIGISDGYIGSDELTQKSFISIPFLTDSKLYNTGDLGVLDKDGNLKLLGRSNRQIKIRGIRIELDGIENILSSHNDIKKAVVVYKENKQALITYLVGNIYNLEEIRKWLENKVPSYMLPQEYFQIEAIPLKQNGKVDYIALQKAEWITCLGGRQLIHEGLEGYWENLVADIWKGVLQVSHVGKYDNFFSFGGHSLLAIQIISKLKSITNLDIPLKSIFLYPTLSEFAKYIDENVQKTKKSTTISRITKRKR